MLTEPGPAPSHVLSKPAPLPGLLVGHDADGITATGRAKLRQLRDDLVQRMRADNSGWEEILNMPENVPEEAKG